MSCRIMATLTADQVELEGLIEDMVEDGLAGVRLNTAHLTSQALEDTVATIREVNPDLVILVDTKGAEARTYGTVKDRDIHFNEGEEVTVICSRKAHESDHRRIYVNADAFPEFSAEGAPDIVIGDNALELKITERVSDTEMRARAIYEGVLSPRQSVSLGACEFVGLEAVTERDSRSIAAAVRAGVDIIAHSFVRSADDIRAVRALTGDSKVQVWAKIECGSAVANLKEIVAEADGVLVARGDLGNAVGLPMVPLIQALTLDEAAEAGKPVMICTQILESMIRSPHPTRAEVDAAWHNCAAGAAWQLLCGETARGIYPELCVAMLHDIIATYDHFTGVAE